MMIPCVSTFSLEDYLKLASEVNHDIIESYSFHRLGETRYAISILLKAVSIFPRTHVNVQVERENNHYTFHTPPIDAGDFVVKANGSFTIVQRESGGSFDVEYNVCFDDLPTRIETFLHRTLARAITRVSAFINENNEINTP